MENYNYPDPMVDFLLSGKAHVYYGLIGSGLLIGLVGMGVLSSLWLFVCLAILSGIFVDLWCHWYTH